MKKSTRVMAARFAPAIGLGVVSGVAVAILVASRVLSPSAPTSAAGKPQQVAVVERSVKTMPTAQTQATKAEASKAPAAGAWPAETLMARATVADMPVVGPTSAAFVEEPPRVTISGCLEHDDEEFRLKDTTGADAPKSRSWKSGFLRKRSASVQVVAAAKRVELPNHVGQRVSLTGVLQDREMQVYLVQRLAASCD